MVDNSLLWTLHLVTGLSVSALERFCATQRYTFYRHARIEKKNGGYRDIYLPSPELKAVQHVIKERYLSELPCSPYAMAYVKGGNVLKNAQVHQENAHFLFLDIQHFFDSIPFDKLRQKLRSQWSDETISDQDIVRLLRICSRKEVFVQGCVTSPVLSNFYMFDFDKRLAAMVECLPNGKYSRYSDDIIISSSERLPGELPNQVGMALRELGLIINTKKTKFVSSMDRAFITGIHLTEDRRFVLNTKYKKQIKKEIYKYLTAQKRSAKMKQRLVGLLGYLKMADSAYFNVLEQKYAQNGLPFSVYLRQSKINDEQECSASNE